MAEKKTPAGQPALFERQNLLLMLIGAAMIAVGMILMVGGRSKDPASFNYDEVYSFMRISVAPVLIIAGLIVEVYAIFKKPKA